MLIVDLLSSTAAPSTVAAGDPESSRLVYAMVIGLVLVGIGLLAVAFWVLRQTRPDLEVLAPLERMGDGDWKKRDPSTQRRMLDEVRPEGAEPLSAEPPPPPIDAEFEQSDHPVTSFSDLGPGVGGDDGDPIPVTDPEDTDDEAVDEPAEVVDEPADEPAEDRLSDPHGRLLD